MQSELKRPAESEKSFWSRVDIRGDDECWPWLASADAQGRGKFWVAGTGKHIPAPRFCLILFKGNPPFEKAFACHTCDNPSCCNPRHLWWGSRSDNMKDCGKKGRHGYQTKYSGENNPFSKLDTNSVRIIRAQYADGRTARDLAMQFGITPSTVWKVATKRSWGHVE